MMEDNIKVLEAVKRLKKARIGKGGVFIWDSGLVKEYRDNFELFHQDLSLVASSFIDPILTLPATVDERRYFERIMDLTEERKEEEFYEFDS